MTIKLTESERYRVLQNREEEKSARKKANSRRAANDMISELREATMRAQLAYLEGLCVSEKVLDGDLLYTLGQYFADDWRSLQDNFGKRRDKNTFPKFAEFLERTKVKRAERTRQHNSAERAEAERLYRLKNGMHEQWCPCNDCNPSR